MDNIEQKTVDLLLDKSKEAFILAIELYNKPSIKYRVEGFAIFICNAWELMLKAYLIKKSGMSSIYYSDNKERTISLENCISKIFTNNKDPLRLNLEKIIELRNTSTHFITTEYEMVYISLFQACVLNFNDKMNALHNIDMTQIIPQNFLTLSVSMYDLKESEIIAKYPDAIANKIIRTNDSIYELSNSNNDKFAITINHHYYITKRKEEATTLVALDKDSDSKMHIVKELKDPNNTHKYTTKACIEKINKALEKNNILPLFNGEDVKVNKFHFQNFCTYFNLKGNEKYCYVHRQFKNNQYTYSQEIIDFIVSEITKDPDNILDRINPYKKIN